jgi:hypothetical protein
MTVAGYEHAPTREGRLMTDLQDASDRSMVADAMNDQIRRSLSRGHRIDITTTGRKTGRPRRIEIVFHNIDGHLIIWHGMDVDAMTAYSPMIEVTIADLAA